MNSETSLYTDILADIAQEELDYSTRQLLLDVRKKWRCDTLTQEEADVVVNLVKDAAESGDQLSLTRLEVHTLFRYMLHVETFHKVKT